MSHYWHHPLIHLISLMSIQGFIHSYPLWSIHFLIIHSHHWSRVIIIPLCLNTFLVQSTSAYVTLSVCHQLWNLYSNLQHRFNCHFSSIYSYHSHYVIIIFKPWSIANKDVKSESFSTFVSCDSISSSSSSWKEKIIKVLTEQGRNLLLVVSSISKVKHQNPHRTRKKPLVGGSKSHLSVYVPNKEETSCWLSSKSSKDMLNKELCLLLAFASSQSLISKSHA